MGFLKSLFGGGKSAATPVAPKQMTGTEHSFAALTYQLSRFQDAETQENIQSESARARFRWTQHKENEFLTDVTQ